MQTVVANILAQIETVVIGKPHQVKLALACVLAKGHVLIEDYPGLAKTLIANSFAGALGLEFKRIQFTPDLLPGDITGGYIFDNEQNKFVRTEMVVGGLADTSRRGD